MQLKPFNVTARVFDPESGATVAEHVLPVDGPDAEHAASATMSNAVAFTAKLGRDGAALPVAFRCMKVEPRG